MLQKIKDTFNGSRIVQYAVMAFLGALVCWFVYPTKHIETTVEQKYEKTLQQEKDQHATEVAKLTENFNKQTSTLKEKNTTLTQKVSILTTQVTDLKKHEKTSYYKVVRPDGTIEIKKFTESDVDESTKVITQIQQEFDEKISSIEKKWEDIHLERVTSLKNEFDSKEKTYQQEISELKSKQVVDINPKHAGLEVGYNTKGNTYLHPTYDLFGPFFVGATAEGNLMTGSGFGGGFGLGIHF